MLWDRLVMPFRIQTLVYQYAESSQPQRLDRALGEMWIPACDLSVRALFHDDAKRCRKFLRFLRAGGFGYFLEQGGQWITYGWCAPPGTNPPHLPGWVGGLGAYWIFYCHTRQEFRNQGYYKQLLLRLIVEARHRAANARVICDTLPGNFASRRALLRAGFEPVGVLTAYRLMSNLTIGGGWRPDELHVPGIKRREAARGGQTV